MAFIWATYMQTAHSTSRCKHPGRARNNDLMKNCSKGSTLFQLALNTKIYIPPAYIPKPFVPHAIIIYQLKKNVQIFFKFVCSHFLASSALMTDRKLEHFYDDKQYEWYSWCESSFCSRTNCKMRLIILERNNRILYTSSISFAVRL